jgi:hypothetical protein
LLALCVLASAQSGTPSEHQYEKGTIVKVQKLQAAPVHTNTDSPLPQNVDNYDVTMQVGNAVYTCRYKAPGGQDISWLKDKARDVRVKRESILLKRLSGEDEVCPIVRKEQTQR